VYTHLLLSGKRLIDPPCIPLKKGDFKFISPLFKGGFGVPSGDRGERGDQNGTCKFKKTCVYTVVSVSERETGGLAHSLQRKGIRGLSFDSQPHGIFKRDDDSL
jgi:hypothetical protein